jgi:hypothetical protein
MAHWKRSTATDGDQIDVNMDAVSYLQEFKEHTAIHSVGGLSAEGKAMMSVCEKPDTIHLANPLVGVLSGTGFQYRHRSDGTTPPINHL